METNNAKIIKCPSCGAKNRVSQDKIDLTPKCGKCHTPLKENTDNDQGEIKLRCTECWAKNKLPKSKMGKPAKCGKCGAALGTHGLLTKSSTEVTDVNFAENILKSPLPALLFAWAPWCPTCQSFLPVVESFAEESEGKVRVGKINVDSSPNVSSKYAIMSVPRILIFDRGKLKEELPGSLQKHELMTQMMKYIL